MGTTFISVRGNGFWMRDSLLELWLRLVSLHVEDHVDRDCVAHQIRDEWLLASRGHFTGCVPVHLEENIATEEGRTIVVTAIQSLSAALKVVPPWLDFNVLNLMGMTGMWT